MDYIRVGHLSTLYHTSIVMQAIPELFEDFPLDIQWNLYGTGPAIVDAFLRDEIELAYIGLPPAVIGMARGVDMVCIAGGHVEGTVIASHSKALSIQDTEDPVEVLYQFKRIGVPGRGSIHDLIINDLIQSCGVDTEIVNFPWADEVLEAFIKGDVDAVVGTPALAEAVIYYGGGRIVYPPEMLWPDNPSYGIVVKKDMLRDRRDLIREFLIAHERSTWLLRNKTAEVAEAIARLLRIVDRNFVLETIRISPHYCGDLTEGYVQCTVRLKDRMKELGYIDRDFSEDMIFDRTLIEEIHPEADHYREPVR